MADGCRLRDQCTGYYYDIIDGVRHERACPACNPEAARRECTVCEGTGMARHSGTCKTCNGTGERPG